MPTQSPELLFADIDLIIDNKFSGMLSSVPSINAGPCLAPVSPPETPIPIKRIFFFLHLFPSSRLSL